MDRLETHQLAYFVAVAEELHFGHAADRLGIAQPPLSRAISRLERRIGAQLLERTSRRVSLTPAGEVFLAESRIVLDALDAAVRRTQHAVRPDRLRLAVRSGTGAGLLLDVLSAYDRHPDSTAIELVFTTDQPTALRDGTADVALLCASEDLGGIETAQLAEEAPVALLPAGHPLADRAAVTLAELRREKTFEAVCPAVGLDEIADLVALGRMIVVTGESATERLGRAVVAVPVADLPWTTLLLAWAPRIRPAALTTFVDIATRVAAENANRVKAS